MLPFSSKEKSAAERIRLPECNVGGAEVGAREVVLIAVLVDILERHRVRPVQATEFGDDLDVLEPVGHQAEEGDVVGIASDLFIPLDGADQQADEELGLREVDGV